MYCSRISNLPFLYKPDGIYESTTKSHFRLTDRTPIPVIQPKITNLTMQRTNFKMTFVDRSGDFVTTHSDFKTLPIVPEGKYPEPTYRSSYTKHEVSPKLIAKDSGSAGQYCTLTMFIALFVFLLFFEQMMLYFFINQVLDQVHGRIKRKDMTVVIKSSSCTDATSKNNHILTIGLCQITIIQSVLFLTQGYLFYQINRSEFPVHVDGPSIRTLSNVTFGRPDLAGKYYSTTSQKQFPSKEVLRPKPLSDQKLTAMQKDFVPLNSRRQELSLSHHVRPRHSKHDFRMTHNETYVSKPYCKVSQDNPSLRNISNMPF
uniref:Si:ch211-198o12.4 n=1 Tax=Cyprinus carpio TaxID=7962 RepID=A0A8C1MKD2_CYPCA